MSFLKQHLGELLQKYPQLKILTGEAIDASRPLLRILIGLGESVKE